jgi:hypothetical protein
MTDWTLTRLSLAAGRWEGRLTGPPGLHPPQIAATWRGAEIAEPHVVPLGEGRWTVAIQLPLALMSDGMQTVAIGPRDEEPLCLETLAFADPVDPDIRAQVEALRTEVELLKRAFRRHLAEGS